MNNFSCQNTLPKAKFGYTMEDIDTIITPMCKTGKEAIGSMGTDTPLAILSEKHQLLLRPQDQKRARHFFLYVLS